MNLRVIKTEEEYQQLLDWGNEMFVKKVGSKGYVSAILNRKKPLTLQLARYFHHELGIPAEVLLS